MAGRTGTSKRTENAGMAIASLVCGIIGLFVASTLLGPMALILGVVAHRHTRSGMAVAGIILGAVDIVLAIIGIAVLNSGNFSWFMGG